MSMMREGKEVREIRIVLSTGRVLLAGLLAGFIFFAAAAGTTVLVDTMRTETVVAESYEAAALPTITAKAWLFAEGYTGPGFEEYILVYNPPAGLGGSGEKIRAIFNFSNATGFLMDYSIVLEPGSRKTVCLNDVLMSSVGYSGDVSVEVHGGSYTNTGINKPIVAERAMYFEYNGAWTGGSQSLGYPLQ